MEPVGTVAKRQSEPASHSYSPQSDGPDSTDPDREEAIKAYQEVKEDITAPTGDLDQDLEQLNVEV